MSLSPVTSGHRKTHRAWTRPTCYWLSRSSHREPAAPTGSPEYAQGHVKIALCDGRSRMATTITLDVYGKPIFSSEVAVHSAG
jgi:hypothetical protein